MPYVSQYRVCVNASNGKGSKVFPNRLGVVGFRAPASGLNVSCSILKITFDCLREVEFRELLASWRKPPRAGLGNKLLHLRLGFTPVRCLHALPEAFAIYAEIGVPSFTAFVEGHPQPPNSISIRLRTSSNLWPTGITSKSAAGSCKMASASSDCLIALTRCSGFSWGVLVG